MNSSEAPSDYRVHVYPKVAKSLSVLSKNTQSKIKNSLRKIELIVVRVGHRSKVYN